MPLFDGIISNKYSSKSLIVKRLNGLVIIETIYDWKFFLQIRKLKIKIVFLAIITRCSPFIFGIPPFLKSSPILALFWNLDYWAGIVIREGNKDT